MSFDQALGLVIRWVLPCALFLAGITLAVLRRRWHPLISLLVIIACGTMLGRYVFDWWLSRYASPHPDIMTFHKISTILERLCFTALGMAAIMGRKQATQHHNVS